MHFYRSLTTIQAMTFDLDDTLYDNRPVIQYLEEQMIEWMAHHHPVSATQPVSWWLALKQELAHQQPLLKHDVTQWRFCQIEQGLKRLGYDDPNAFQAAQQAIDEVLRLRNLVDVPAETHRVMQLLADKIPLIAITNGNVDPDKIGLGHYFKLVLKAGPDGWAKPFPDMFDKAAAALGNIDRRAILHIGDHPRTDVLGAWQNGLSSCWFNDQGQSGYHLGKLKVLPDVEVTQLAELLDLV